ncbi:MAG: nuclear transport factor 2 family protein [Actinobacteria bacterium]|nr:nuclear transport factor 2 family protein [Actinomycetota bacterium]
MRESADVKDLFLRWCDRLSAKDVASFDQLVSAHPATLVIGTAPGEWVTERSRLRYGFEAEGVRLDPKDPKGYEEASLGWFVDEPVFYFPDGSALRTRLTGIAHRENDGWRIVHMHFSVGVPDDEVIELQRRWSADRW